MRSFPVENVRVFFAVVFYNSLRSFSQLGRGRILMPDTNPMAMNSVRVDEPP